MSVLGRPTWAIFNVNLHQRVTALVVSNKLEQTQFTNQTGIKLLCMGKGSTKMRN